MKKIILTVTTDLNYDQRMIRICTSLSKARYDVTLVGMERPSSDPLKEQPYRQHRIPVGYEKGKRMYGIYWYRLYRYLMRSDTDAICAIDLDTILPVYYASRKKRVLRVFDAHEIFTEMQEVNSRPAIKKLWERIGSLTVPRFPVGYTIGDAYAAFYKKKYGVRYQTVRNATLLRPFSVPEKKERYICYQGAVNKGRAFEYLIPAMQHVDAPLYIIGKGNFSEQTAALIRQYGVEDKVKMLGYKLPGELKQYTEQAWIGVTLFDAEGDGKSNYYSMANRFFDYMHHGVPQLCCTFPEYVQVNKTFEIACLVPDLQPASIAEGLNRLLKDDAYHERLSANAMKAREVYCWQEEEKKLLEVYRQLFSAK